MMGFGVFAAFTVATNTYFGVTGASTWVSQNAAVIPMAIAAFVAAFVRDRRVQVSSLTIELMMWAWYFWSLQGALAG